MIGLTLVTGPVSEPVSTDTLKDHLRINWSDEDDQLEAYITTARQTFENLSNLALGAQTWKLTLDHWPQYQTIYLPRPPLQSVTHVKYYDEAGAQQTYSSGNYVVDVEGRPGRIFLPYSLPALDSDRKANVEVRFVCGETTIPQAVKTAIMLLAGHFYAQREAYTADTLKELPLGFGAVVDQYKTGWGDYACG